MTSDDSLSLILRRLDEIERKLDRMMGELRTPTAIGYSGRRGNFQGRIEFGPIEVDEDIGLGLPCRRVIRAFGQRATAAR